MKFRLISCVLLTAAMTAGYGAAADDVDPYLYLEATTPTQAVTDFITVQNTKVDNTLTQDSRYAPTKALFTELVYAADRLPAISATANGWVYNFWQDETNPHGIYRRATLAEFKKTSPKWEVLFDVDAVSKTEGVNWVWKGINCLEPEYKRCTVSLSNGGKDASVLREYDLEKHQFVAGGFTLPEAKTSVSWIDQDTLFVATDEGPDSLTESGYPRILRRWKRGQPESAATIVLTGEKTDIRVDGQAVHDSAGTSLLVARSTDFQHAEMSLLVGDQLQRMPFPTDADVSVGGGGYAVVFTKSPWALGDKTYATGSLLAFHLNDLNSTKPIVVFTPTATKVMSSWQLSGDSLYVACLNNVVGELYKTTKQQNFGQLTAVTVPPMGSITLGLSSAQDATLVFEFASFLNPTTYFTVAANSTSPDELKTAPARFDASKYVTEQMESTSKDGTKIPYFVIHAKNWKLDGNNPTLMYGYGGFEDSMTPWYSGSYGRAWMEKGGVFVVANIRGGDEFGPAWHTQALKEHRQLCYDDFISVAEDLIARKITKPAKLGIQGGSNGGLLVGAVFVERPDLFNAVVSEVPLLDMIRYPYIFAGASWEAEYGDPSVPQIRDAILKYSPYQNVQAGVKYPKVFFKTSSTDDRVGPAHARKMAAKMIDQGHDILFWEDTEGGHGGGDTPEETIRSQSLTFTYLYQQLMSQQLL